VDAAGNLISFFCLVVLWGWCCILLYLAVQSKFKSCFLLISENHGIWTVQRTTGSHTERRQKIIWTTTASAASDNYIVASLFPCHALQAHGYRTIWLWNWRKLVSSFNKRPRLGYERPPGPESCPGCSINCLTVMFVHVLRSVHLEMRIDDGEVYWQTSSFPIKFVRETSHSLFSIKL
jgi:hypothetical protein